MSRLLNELCGISGISGREENVCRYIISEISGYCDINIDNMGNLIAFKKGRYQPYKKIMYLAHMDEVGFIVNHITDDGLLKFLPIGGIDTRVVLGRKVKLYPSGKYGVVGTKAIHMQSEEERNKAPLFKDMYIDIGATSKEMAAKFVTPGDYAVFDSEFISFGDGLVKSKAIDDRFGCNVLIKMIKSDLKYDTYFVFATQEEIGCNGSLGAAFGIKPDLSIIIEATTAADIGGVANPDKVCSLKEGAVLSFIDRGTIYDKELFNLAIHVAEKNNIKYQLKKAVAGGNDSSSVQKSGLGSKVLAISVPCRYIHSPSCVVAIEDCESVEKLSFELLENLGEI